MARDVSIRCEHVQLQGSTIVVYAWTTRGGYSGSWLCEACGQRGDLGRSTASLEAAIADLKQNAETSHAHLVARSHELSAVALGIRLKKSPPQAG